ncbi:Conserved oligomeric Golgi complex subunit 5 [Hypsizygus marmoreus]|uniref:Conserved oligomeric Golgi complex subunit 5 n=1 Tax=Hypsizygus marmoreus TaxID=39966 RepID=A0A369JW27_HYPMA|nr:Conserved oligomeric Golgi complex subunit 5 [Hypsizygus marmoreus]
MSTHVIPLSSDFTVFAIPEFDPNEYANAILAGESYPPASDSKTGGKLPLPPQDLPAKEDISVAISKLTFGIDDVSKQIKNVVAVHHEDLLSQAASANDLSGSLTSVRGGLNDLEASLEKLRLKIRVPYQSLQTNVSRLQKLQQASDVLRRTSRFVILARRLQLQMVDMDSSKVPDSKSEGRLGPSESSDSSGLLASGHGLEDEKERTIAKAALSIAELGALLDGPNIDKGSTSLDRYRNADGTASTDETSVLDIPLRSINAVAAHVPFIEEARAKVTSEMETMVLTGLSTLNQSLLASSLQTAYNLRVLPELVQNLIFDLSQAVEERIRSAFDITKISKDALARDPAASSPQSPPTYRSRVRTEPTNVTAPQFTAALWSRLEVMIEDMADCCVKVYTLEKVLKMKKDAVTQVVFLDEAMKLLENKPSATFWTSLGRSLEKHARDSAKSSTFLQQTLSAGYPKLLRLFQEFFAKIAVHTDTVYGPMSQSPETVFVLRSLSNFESLYLSRSSNKLNEAVAQAFSGGVRAPPGYNEGINIARTVANELDTARFDPLLVKSVAKNAASSLNMLLSRVDNLTVRDRSAVTLVGPMATPQQASNAQLATCLYQCWSRLEKLQDDHTETVFGALKPSVQSIFEAYEGLVEPVMTAVRRELSAIIAKLHRIDFGKAVDPMSGMGGSSFYMKDLVEKLSFIKAEVLSKFSIGEAGRAWTTSIVKFVIRNFVMHVSIARPLGESGKLRLTSDMTELEFALSAFMVENPQSKRGGNLETIGEEYRTLRALRPLLFLENALLAVPEQTAGLPPLIVLHHILVRSPMPLPHNLHGWQEAEYVRWVDEHTEREAWSLVEGGLSHWEKVSESEGKETADAKEYIDLARTVLRNAQSL